LSITRSIFPAKPEPGSVRWFLQNHGSARHGGQHRLKRFYDQYVEACRAHGAEILRFVEFNRDLGPHIVTQAYVNRETVVTLEGCGRTVKEARDRADAAIAACFVFSFVGTFALIGLGLAKAYGLA
jgi:hypothetical protein